MKKFVLTVMIFCLAFAAVGQNKSAEIENALAQAEKFNALRDYAGGADFAAEMSRRFPAELRFKTWAIIFAARADITFETVEAAEKLFAENPTDKTALYALATAYLRASQFDKALETSEKAVRLAPDDEKTGILYTYTLMAKKRFAEALNFLEAKNAVFSDKSTLLTTKAEIFYRQKEKEKSFNAFDQAVTANPQSVNALYAAGYYNKVEKKFVQALPLLKRAVELSPRAFQIRQAYLEGILQTQPQNTSEKRAALIDAEIDAFLKVADETPQNLAAAAAEYRKYEIAEKQKALEEKLLREFPQTAESERILINRIRRSDTGNELKRAAYVKVLRDFLARPQFFNPRYAGEVYTNLIYNLIDDIGVSDAEFLKLADQAVKFEGLSVADPFRTIANGLIKRKLYAEAEKFAAQGLADYEERLAKARKRSFYTEMIEKSDRTALLNFRGEALLRRKNYDEAEKFLRQSVAVSQKANVAYKLLGELYEATARFDAAEDAYISDTAFIRTDKTDFEPLKNLYLKRNKNLNGFDAYKQKVLQISKQKLREFILADRLSEPKPPATFSLPTADGKTFSSADLKGKITVVNIWASWCVPCVREMPDLQALYRKYRKSADVSVITINNEEDSATIKKFMTAGKYDFPVLLSGDYFTEEAVDAFPTTWFIDKQGKIVYAQIGYSKFLLEEFDWRIAELRNSL